MNAYQFYLQDQEDPDAIYQLANSLRQLCPGAVQLLDVLEVRTNDDQVAELMQRLCLTIGGTAKIVPDRDNGNGSLPSAAVADLPAIWIPGAPVEAGETEDSPPADDEPEAELDPERPTYIPEGWIPCPICGDWFEPKRRDSTICSKKSCRNKKSYLDRKARLVEEKNGHEPAAGASEAPRSGVSALSQAKEWAVDGEDLDQHEFRQRVKAGLYPVGTLVRHREKGDFEVVAGKGFRFKLRAISARPAKRTARRLN